MVDRRSPMTRQEWIDAVRRDWLAEPCHVCGHQLDNAYIDEDGTVWVYCGWEDKERAVYKEVWPSSFAPPPPLPDPASDDLPF